MTDELCHSAAGPHTPASTNGFWKGCISHNTMQREVSFVLSTGRLEPASPPFAMVMRDS